MRCGNCPELTLSWDVFLRGAKVSTVWVNEQAHHVPRLMAFSAESTIAETTAVFLYIYSVGEKKYSSRSRRHKNDFEIKLFMHGTTVGPMRAVSRV
jgi:hypothetical protein